MNMRHCNCHATCALHVTISTELHHSLNVVMFKFDPATFDHASRVVLTASSSLQKFRTRVQCKGVRAARSSCSVFQLYC